MANQATEVCFLGWSGRGPRVDRFPVLTHRRLRAYRHGRSRATINRRRHREFVPWRRRLWDTLSVSFETPTGASQEDRAWIAATGPFPGLLGPPRALDQHRR